MRMKVERVGTDKMEKWREGRGQSKMVKVYPGPKKTSRDLAHLGDR